MGNEDLVAVDYLCKRGALVLAPLVHHLRRFDEDNVIFILTFVVDYGLTGVSTRHDGKRVYVIVENVSKFV